MEQLSDIASCRSGIVPKSYTVDIDFEDLSLTLKSVSFANELHELELDNKQQTIFEFSVAAEHGDSGFNSYSLSHNMKLNIP